MAFQYIARIYFDKKEIEHQDGNDVDELYSWMLIKTQDAFGNFHGEIIELKTGKTIRRFCKSPPD